ncbi:hypothetical protein JMJ35_008284 [Cladonia borealis]|uniref:Uncharacterized protein n=1 Tax=Cladonia borealis TaxID=184061 RepID=A0AA39QWC3_9LECA|nr:hypothetical protein JMJ35_008284 [Cladonia borealis]
MLFPTSLTLILLPLLAAASDIFCEECGVNGIFYLGEDCTNSTYVAPLFGGDAGECFEIGAPYTSAINEVSHMPFGKEATTHSVLIQVEKDGCEVKFYSGLQCTAGTGTVVALGECASDTSSSGWGSFCVSCPASSSVYGAGTSCP